MTIAAFIPVEPLPPEARDQLIAELSKPEYAEAQPTLVDRIGLALAQWFSDLFSGGGGAPPIVAIIVGLAVAAAVIMLAVLFGGRIRWNRKAAGAATLFGEAEHRSARELRADAAAAARRGDWPAAIADAFRAIARDAADRELLVVLPGLTAHGFAARAGAELPAESEALERAATAFDEVRYLGLPGSEAAYREVAELDRRLAQRVAATEPEQEPVP